MNHSLNIAIDGPAGAGKSTVAKIVAERLSYLYIDTGAMYRTLAYAALTENVDVNDGDALKALLDHVTIELVNDESGLKVLLNGHDISEEIRTIEVSKQVPLVASHELVRVEMVERQRQLAAKGQTVLDGRDIGTHVLPDAKVKVFLTASVEIRAKRRHEELLKKGYSSDLEELKKDIAKRDEIDSTRAFAPLRKASHAIEINTSLLSIDEVVDAIIDLVEDSVLT
ncbi:(d)CMP kinase [Halalkalibacter alkalisediminis]|uniref:Cytidylate kinase n=1 Tax=Halalkalibacter alkalisediminis TaxID=935616 RepID=A0ABV6NEP8_9BACI|nr:(d)CMP kinase [Halalkalibacter alkalisediminis]